ncbi:MAG: hypothetical protein JJLCMIEE_02897 [Acidimicrobiales bacterium]|nr:MAG: sulfite exporter TauE/SafE family protein [Actinomycetota bacterium]MBV6509798.1 hypothetical protein [Acidimicrobiales bacterium]RIK04397.1 MAG: hypothetical protein DCC48_13540 [Acidobacteriota bacterium]
MSAPDFVYVALAVAAGSLIKSVTGLGLPLIAVPVLAIPLGVETAVVVMALPSVLSNAWLVTDSWSARGDSRHVGVMLVLGALAVPLGALVLEELNETSLALVLASLVTLYVVVLLVHPDFRLSERVTKPTAPLVAVVSGALHGATGISGPLIGTYFHAFRLPRDAYLFSTTTLFALFSLVQAISIAVLGLYTWSTLVASALALVPVVVVFPIGIRLSRRMASRTFETVVLVVLVAAVAVLVVRAI